MIDGNKKFQVVGKDGKKYFFDIKTVAKTFRDSPLAADNATVGYGPDHPKHHSNRRAGGWNKGRHPKKGSQGNKRAQLANSMRRAA